MTFLDAAGLSASLAGTVTVSIRGGNHNPLSKLTVPTVLASVSPSSGSTVHLPLPSPIPYTSDFMRLSGMYREALREQPAI